MFVKVIDERVDRYPYTLSHIYADNPQTSFPSEIPAETLAEFGVYPVVATERPADRHDINVREAEPVFDGAQWRQVWVVEPASAAEIAARLDAQWTEVRAERNARLAACDWTQLADAPVDAAKWRQYRQALRDITQQSDPFDIKWPEA